MRIREWDRRPCDTVQWDRAGSLETTLAGEHHVVVIALHIDEPSRLVQVDLRRDYLRPCYHQTEQQQDPPTVACRVRLKTAHSRGAPFGCSVSISANALSIDGLFLPVLVG